MSEHTPGPWAFITDSAEGSPFFVRAGFMEVQVGGASLNEAHANARLIAAAPDMLALLERVTPANPFTGPELSGGPACIGCGASRGNDRHDDPRNTCSWAAARAVIAKAKGEA